MLLLGGGLGDSALKALAHAPEAGRWYRCPVAAAALGDDAGMIGSALAALEAAGQADASRPTATAGKRLILVNGVPASARAASPGASQRAPARR